MTFELTAEQEAVKELIEQFCKNVVAPKAAEVDKTGKFPKETFAQLAEQGLILLDIPVEYGGAGLDTMCKAMAIMEISKYCGSTGEAYAVQGLVADVINTYGTEAQKQKYLPMMAAGKMGAFSLTEPCAGSDAAGIKTRAVLDGDYYVLNGTKCFCSNMGPDEGEFAIVACVTDPEKGAKGISTILVERGTPGFKLGKTEDKMGLRGAAVSELIFEDCRVPKENLIAKEGEGFKVAMASLDGGRIGIGSMSLGIAMGALDEAIAYSKQRVAFGKPIAMQPVLQQYMADMATKIEAAYCLLCEAVDLKMRGQNYSKVAAMIKYYASEIAVEVCDKAVQIHGGYGYMKDYAVERMYRDVKLCTIGEGTSEIQKLVIAKTILK